MNSLKTSRTDRSSYITAYWYTEDGVIDQCPRQLRPGQIEYFAQHTVELENKVTNERKKVTLCIAKIQWFKRIDQQHHFAEFASVWQKDFEQESPASFMPVTRVYARIAPYFGPINVGLGEERNLVAVTTLDRKVSAKSNHCFTTKLK